MILCRIHQWLWSQAHDSVCPLPESTRKHLLKCEACRDVTKAMNAVDGSLRLANPSPSEEWHSALMDEIRRIPPPLSKTAPTVRSLPLALAGMAAALAVALYLYDFGSSVDSSHNSDDILAGSMSVLDDLASSLKNESIALEQDLRHAARMATACLPL